jgi:hypothetical protein
VLEPGQRSRYSDSLRARKSGDRVPVTAIISAPVETGSEAHTASYRRSTGSFLEVKRLGGGVDHPLPFSAEVNERVEIYVYSPSGYSWPVLGWNYLSLLLFSVILSMTKPNKKRREVINYTDKTLEEKERKTLKNILYNNKYKIYANIIHNVIPISFICFFCKTLSTWVVWYLLCFDHRWQHYRQRFLS